jgi:hypothetical protein
MYSQLDLLAEHRRAEMRREAESDRLAKIAGSSQRRPRRLSALLTILLTALRIR